MSLNMIVLVKQVPDTHHVSSDAMKPDGTVNRAALPAIINPEDLNALEEALKIKEKVGGKITVITMGPAKAQESLKECLYRGADDAVLISDRRFAAADTLATSVFAMGPEDGITLIESLDHTEGFIINADGTKVYMSSGVSKYLSEGQ